MNIKVGDKVLCINDQEAYTMETTRKIEGVTKGNIYSVLGYIMDMVKIKKDNGYPAWLCDNRFLPVVECKNYKNEYYKENDKMNYVQFRNKYMPNGPSYNEAFNDNFTWRLHDFVDLFSAPKCNKNFTNNSERKSIYYSSHTINYSKHDLVNNTYLTGRIEVPPTSFEVIHQDTATVVILDDGSKGVAKCGKDDVYDKEIGFQIAYRRAKIKQIEKEIKELGEK